MNELNPMPSQAAAPPYEAPDGEIEQLLAAWWRELLATEQLSRHDNFFHRGGTSLLAVKLVGRIRRQLQVELTPRQIFERRTLSAIAALLEQVLLKQLADSEGIAA